MNLSQDLRASIDERDLQRTRLPGHLHGARLAQLKGDPVYEPLTRYMSEIHRWAASNRGLCLVGPATSDRLTPAAVLLRAFGLYGATTLYVHADDLRSPSRHTPTRAQEAARIAQVLLIDDLPIAASAQTESITQLIRRRKSAGLVTLATLSQMVCLLDSTLRDAYTEAMFLACVVKERVWIDTELPVEARVYGTPGSRTPAAPVPVLTPPQAVEAPADPTPELPRRAPEPTPARRQRPVDREDRPR